MKLNKATTRLEAEYYAIHKSAGLRPDEFDRDLYVNFCRCGQRLMTARSIRFLGPIQIWFIKRRSVIRKELPNLVSQIDAKSLLDIPGGDFN